MADYKEIVKAAQDSYNRFFKDIPELPEEKNTDDIIEDYGKIEKIINDKKVQLEAHKKNIAALTEELDSIAEAFEEKTFPQEHVETKAVVDKFAKEYGEAEKRLAKLAEKLQELKK